MRITSITPQERNPSRRNIFVDGQFALGVGPETLLRFGLRTGDELTPTLLQQLEQAEELVSAHAAAMRFLGVRPRTEKEIRDKLREKEYGDEEIQRTIASLKAARLLDDAEFARAYVSDQLAKKPAGALLLRRKLLLLGVSKDIIEETLKGFLGPEADEQRALSLARDFVRKSRALRPNEVEVKLRQRTSTFLGRRGFTWDVIRAVSKTLFSHTEDDTDGQSPE